MNQSLVSFPEAVKRALIYHYCDFSGRASRSELWWFWLFAQIGFMVITKVLNAFEIEPYYYRMFVWVLLIPPFLGLGVRRMHDVGKSGWWLFSFFIPFAGPFYLLHLLTKDSDPESNDYGDVPNCAEA